MLEKKAESSKVALTQSRVAGTVAAKDEAIAMEMLRKAISAVNSSDVKRTETNSHKVEFDNKVFELLAVNYRYLSPEIERAPERNKNRRELNFFARLPRSERSISDDQFAMGKGLGGSVKEVAELVKSLLIENSL